METNIVEAILVNIKIRRITYDKSVGDEKSNMGEKQTSNLV